MIQLHNTWNILDSTKIERYMAKPRAFFYEYVLGWRSEEENINLVFGKAWHKAMRYLMNNGLTQEAAAAAFTFFLEEYRKSFTEAMDAIYHPKSPGNAEQALLRYILEYMDKDDFEILHTEIGGTVSIAENRVLYFKLDTLVRDCNNGNKVCSIEHKTSKQNSQPWRDGFKLAFQTGTYNHVQYCLYPEDQVYGTIVNGAVFTKGKGVEFVRIPARRSLEMMDVWLDQANFVYEEIMRDFERLAECKEEDTVMKAFRCRPTNCMHYGTCAYALLCMSWANPLQHLEEIPEGFKVEFWDPREEELDLRVEVGR